MAIVRAAADYLARLPRAPGADGTLWLDRQGRVLGRFLGCQLLSVFQPIVDLGEGRAAGEEAFVRSLGAAGEGLSPWNLFFHAAGDQQLIALDRLCRTLHAVSYFGANRPGPLFLNVHGRLMLAIREDHGRVFREVIDRLGVAPERVVIEAPESLADDPALLGFVLRNYRRNGYRVALNITRAGQLDGIFEHVIPDYVKLDVGHADGAPGLRGLVERVARQGATLIAKRVGNPTQLDLVRQAGVRLAQGQALAAEAASVPLPKQTFLRDMHIAAGS